MVMSIRITSAIVFFVAAHLLVPRIADAAARLRPVNMSINSFVNVNIDYLRLDSKNSTNKLLGNYEPPNYGDPDSRHGSGTR